LGPDVERDAIEVRLVADIPQRIFTATGKRQIDRIAPLPMTCDGAHGMPIVESNRAAACASRCPHPALRTASLTAA
jgi:hypothetical protein